MKSQPVPNSFLASRPQHQFWKHFLQTITARVREVNDLSVGQVENLTGPKALISAIKEWTGDK
jgi:hypothetical protein